MFDNRKPTASPLCAAILVCLAAAPAHAMNWSLVNDFSVANGNANGVWNYMADESLMDHASVFDGIESWHTGALPDEASVTRNASNPSTALSPEYSVYIPRDYLNLDPQSMGSVEVVFSAPTAGVYSFVGSFLGDDDGSNAGGLVPPHAVRVVVDDQSAFDDSIGAFKQMDIFSGQANLQRGGTIAFEVDSRGYSNLGTGLRADISGPATEPTTWALMLVGVGTAGAALRGSRRRRSIA